MKKRLRLLAWMLTLTMLCEVLPFGAFAQSDVGQQLTLAAAQSLEEENGEATIIGKCGDNLQWSLSSDGVLTIDGTGKMFDYNSVPPYNISPWYHNTNITTLIVKEGVTSIGDYAFLGCYKISNISFPNSLTSIGYSAFDPCSGLTEITLPENLIYLGGYSLTSGNFSSISIPIGITSIEKYTFANCKKLKSVSLPDTLTSIGEGTFNQCTSLDSFNIPKNVVDIGRYAFWNCTSLKHIEIPSGIPQINEGTFDNCSSLKSISIPSSVVSIGESAFYGCNSLEDVYFSGTQSQWENISVANYQNTALENATIHYQSTGPEDEKEFTFGRDNLSFLNHSDYFFKRSNPIMSSFFDFIVKPNYINATLALSDEKFDLLTKNYVPRVKTVLDLCRSSSWGGSCLGMTDVAAIHYISPYKLPFSAATTYDLAAPVNDKSVQDLINYYQILQYSPTLRKVAIDRVVFCGDNFDEAISEIVTSLNTGYPVLALIASEGHSSHFILLLNIQEETHEYYAIRVYDPNQSKEKILYLHKFFSEKIGQLPISYESCDVTYNRINYYLLCKNDLQFLDLRNFYGIGDNETATDYDGNFVIVNSDYSLSLKWGRAYYRASNGKLVEYSDDITVIPDGSTMADGTYAGNLWISVPTPTDGSDFTLETSSSDTGLTSLLLNDTLLSISTSGPVELTYNEADRTVDVTAEAPTDVNLLMTKNDVNESWPWHSWALDTTGTTTLHADLDDDGLHLSGDGITNAKYATENADTENVDSGTISVQPDADGITTVTITNKKSSSGDSLEIVTPSAPTTGNAITITNGFAYIDDPEQPVNSAALGDVVTIVANDRSSEGKTFTGWVMNSGDVTLNDSSASPTSFTMGDKAVSITAQYSTNSTPTPTPGGGSSSGGGGGGGGGASVKKTTAATTEVTEETTEATTSKVVEGSTEATTNQIVISDNGEVKIVTPDGTEVKVNVPKDVVNSDVNFSDLGNYGWAKDYINKLAELGIVTGTEDGIYSPELGCKRGDFAILINRTLGLQVTPTKNFSDNEEGKYYYNDVRMGYTAGILSGYGDNTYKPEKYCNRDEMFVLVAKTLEYLGVDVTSTPTSVNNKYNDVADVAWWSAPYLAFLTQEGIVTGSSNGNVEPKKNINRAEMAVMMYKDYEFVKDYVDGLVKDAATTTTEETTEETTVDESASTTEITTAETTAETTTVAE